MVLGSVALGATALGLFFLEWAPVAELGEGGIERWIVYPIVLWLVAFGSYLMATPATPIAARQAGPSGLRTGPASTAGMPRSRSHRDLRRLTGRSADVRPYEVQLDGSTRWHARRVGHGPSRGSAPVLDDRCGCSAAAP